MKQNIREFRYLEGNNGTNKIFMRIFQMENYQEEKNEWSTFEVNFTPLSLFFVNIQTFEGNLVSIIKFKVISNVMIKKCN